MTDLRQAALEQQAEPPPEWPLIKNILAVFGLDAIAFVAEWKAAQQQAEPVALWQKRHLLRTEGAWENTNEHDAKWWSEKAQGWEIRALYTTPPQRKELSASEILNMMPSTIPAEYDGELMEFARAVEAKLKERNT